MTEQDGNELSLAALAHEIPGGVEIVGSSAVTVRGIRHDSRAVSPGDLFAARKGARADGAAFVAQALSRGAVAVLAARGAIDPASVPVPVLLVDDAQAGLAYAAAAIYGHPTFTLDVVGITGTNGKTTVSHLVRAAIDSALGVPSCGTIGTVGHTFRGLRIAGEHTTPEADEIARVMASMLAEGATHVAMEVSSHALTLGRVSAVRFRVAAFTNLTQDHLDFHGTMGEYGEAKARLFTDHAPGAAVICVDDPFGRALTSRVRAPLVKVSARSDTADADVAPRSASLSPRGIDAVFRTPVGDVRIASRLVGAHNLENLAVALGVAHALELDLERAAVGLTGEGGAPGRLERCDTTGDDITVLVDYAHTPGALARVLESVRAVTTSRIWCVFGCGGDRDATKRAPMGEAAARGADVLVVTNDNPRTEEPAKIAASVVEGVEAAGVRILDQEGLTEGAHGYVVQLDRAEAIRTAVTFAAPGDVVLLAGKGHEDYQIVGTEKRAFDDRIEARRALDARRKRSSGEEMRR